MFKIILNNFNHEIPYFVKIIFWNENIIKARRLNNLNNAIRTNQRYSLTIRNDPLREPLNPNLWLVNMDIIWSIKKRLKSHPRSVLKPILGRIKTVQTMNYHGKMSNSPKQESSGRLIVLPAYYSPHLNWTGTILTPIFYSHFTGT